MNLRRLLPSMSLLVAFEASARLASFTRAADELALTQSAVSRQVQTLEELLGVALFVRVRRHIVLTEVGNIYREEVAAALGRIREASARVVRSTDGSRILRLSTIPTFSSKFILPRIHTFYDAYPEIQVDIRSRFDNNRPDFSEDEADAAIIAGHGHWSGVVSHSLVPVEMAVIASPDLMASRALKNPEDLHAHLLLRIKVRPDDWVEWFTANNLPYSRMRFGPSFELTSHMIQAATSGVGVGLLPKALIDEELSAGILVSPFPAMKTERSYYLVYPETSASLPSLQAFRTWLLSLLDENRCAPGS